ncbi:MAG TPA: hypothetical protein VMR14_20570 [Streptosporangiaceae bacterium]|nr:hypothetical protein [Streptosporangiaceae bacterium]
MTIGGEPALGAGIVVVPDQSPSRRQARRARRRDKIKAKVAPALAGVMAPGDTVVAGVLTETGTGKTRGPEFVLTLIMAAATIVVSSLGLAGLAVGQEVGGVATLMGLATCVAGLRNIGRKTVFIAVTRDSVIGYRLSRSGNRPLYVLFRESPQNVRVSGRWRGRHAWYTLRLAYPGWNRPLCLSVLWSWGPELRELVTALQGSGAFVVPSE